MPNAPAINGIVRAGQLLIHGMGVNLPSQETVMKLGTQVTASGSMSVDRSKAKRKPLPGNSMRAKA